jgi:hypothetical protein
MVACHQRCSDPRNAISYSVKLFDPHCWSGFAGSQNCYLLGGINSLEKKNLLYAENDYNSFDILRWNLHHCPMRAPRTPSKPSFLFPYKTNSNPHIAFIVASTVISIAHSLQY